MDLPVSLTCALSSGIALAEPVRSVSCCYCEVYVPTVMSLWSYKISLALTGMSIAIFVAAQTPAAAFECPVAHGLTSSSAIKETLAQIAQLTSELEADETGNTTTATIWELRHKYPKAGSDEIVNYMVTAYCPIVSQNASLSDNEKEARLKLYSQQIAALAIH